MAAGGADLQAAALPDQDRIIRGSQDILKLQKAFPGRRGERQPGVGIEGDKVDLGAAALEQPGQLPGLVRGVVQALQQDVGKGDAPVPGQGEALAGRQELCQGIVPVDGHEPVAGAVIRGV